MQRPRVTTIPSLPAHEQNARAGILMGMIVAGQPMPPGWSATPPPGGAAIPTIGARFVPIYRRQIAGEPALPAAPAATSWLQIFGESRGAWLLLIPAAFAGLFWAAKRAERTDNSKRSVIDAINEHAAQGS